ncbi:MAG: TRAP transporter substrate-binding protein, partial [Dehalococcoidia bacterium]
EALEAVSTGVVPAITPFADYLSGSHPELMFLEVPGLVKNPTKDLLPILDAGVWDILNKSLAKDNATMVMYWTRGHAASTACKTHYLKRPEDFKGIQISAPGGLLSEIIKAIGGTVTPIPGPELYQSLQTGVIDACFTSIDAGVLAEKTYEIAPYVVWYPEALTGENPYVLLINLDVWNGFPEDIQKAILKAGRETTEFAAEYTYDYLDGVEAQLAEVGITVEHLTDAEAAVLLGLTEERVRQWWLEQTGDLGNQIIDIIAEYYR